MAGYTPAEIAALLEGPADAAPNGSTYNFDIRPPHNQEGIAVVAVCLTLVTTAVLLRAYSRIRVTKNVFIEDCTLDETTLLLFRPSLRIIPSNCVVS